MIHVVEGQWIGVCPFRGDMVSLKDKADDVLETIAGGLGEETATRG